MNFFIPSAKDRDQAEIVWSVVRKGLADRGLATTPRRIRALAWQGDGETHYIAVGADPPVGRMRPRAGDLRSERFRRLFMSAPSGRWRGSSFPGSLASTRAGAWWILMRFA